MPDSSTDNVNNNPSVGWGGTIGVGIWVPSNPVITPVLPTTRDCPEQVIGLVPVFPCTNDECREYRADNIYDHHQFPLPVFADLTDDDLYKNDYNGWMFNYPPQMGISSSAFYLDQYVNGAWVEKAQLNDGTYGTYYVPTKTQDQQANILCSVKPWYGYLISWRKVLDAFGEGKYRFRVQSIIYFKTSCCASPPFCLRAFDCLLADRTVKWEANYVGGTFGSIDRDCYLWNFCCCIPNPEWPNAPCNQIYWYDSVRLEGFFGYEKSSYERIKNRYTTGESKKVRDKAIQKFTWKSGSLPKWAHDRLKAYGLMADNLLVSDYNINNSDYEIKRKWVECDSGYEPVYKGWTRYSKVDVEFTEGCQRVIRTRCC